MVDLVSTWIAYFLPMINWFIPKKYAKISREEFESLNIVKPAKNNTFWPVAGFAVLLTTLTRKYIYLLNIHLEKRNSYINMLYDTSRCFRIVYIYKYKIEVTYF